MNPKKIIPLTLIASLLLSSCGTMFGGTKKEIAFSSNVDEATVLINGNEACKTPCTYQVEKSSDDLNIIVRKSGYMEETGTINVGLNLASLLNILLPSFICFLGTDLTTGGIWNYKDQYYVALEPDAPMVKAEEKAFKKKIDIDRYIYANYESLAEEAAKNKAGEHIKAFTDKTGVSEKKLMEIINETNSADELSEKLTDKK